MGAIALIGPRSATPVNIGQLSRADRVFRASMEPSSTREPFAGHAASRVNEKEILLINQGEIFAIENLCPHMDLPLDIGQITAQDTILCPYHNSEFCFKSGKVKKWVGKHPHFNQHECKPLNKFQVLKDTDYIWVTYD